MRLEGKIGIVTAAASAMGRAGALRFARERAAAAQPQTRLVATAPGTSAA